MSDFIVNAIAIMIIVLMFLLPIALAIIIALKIADLITKSKNNKANYYLPPTNVNYQQPQVKPPQNFQNVQPINVNFQAKPQQNYNKVQAVAQNYRPQTNYVPPVNNRYIPPQNTNQNYSNNPNFPYQAVSLLTEREYNFFKVLRVIAERNNLNVLMKIRLADLVKVKDSIPKSEFYKYFNKISAKHIDFALINGTKVVVLIELDDSTHSRANRIERDNFVNETVTKCGYKIIHTYGDTKQIEDAILQYKKSNVSAMA